MTFHGGSGAKRIIDDAVVRKDAKAGDRLLDRAFALAFKGLVYAQIWEDPVIDMEGLQIGPGMRVMLYRQRSSCNALSYLTADPAEVVAVDLNRAHVALGKLKIAAIRNLPNYERFRRFFAEADHQENAAVYRESIAPHLDSQSRRYWEGRDLTGRRRISHFTRGIYRQGAAWRLHRGRSSRGAFLPRRSAQGTRRKYARGTAGNLRDRTGPRVPTAPSCAG